jgi:hypothetical protein
MQLSWKAINCLHTNSRCGALEGGTQYYLPIYIVPAQYVTLQDKTRLMSQILKSEILVLCESVLQERPTNIFDIIILQFHW